MIALVLGFLLVWLSPTPQKPPVLVSLILFTCRYASLGYCIIMACVIVPHRSQALDVLGSAVSCPRLQGWEVKDQINKTQLSLAIAAAQPYTGG